MLSKRYLFVLPLAVLAASSALVVHAQPPSGNVITACTSPAGYLRVVSSPTGCLPSEQVLSWGGLSGYEIVSDDYMFPQGTTGAFGSKYVQCPVGKKVLGGGAVALLNHALGGVGEGFSSALSFAGGSYPSAEDTWTVSYELTTGNGSVAGFRVYATCAS